MKRIVAIVREERVERVLDALSGIGMRNAAVSRVAATGPANVDEGAKINIELVCSAADMARIEFYCPDEYVEQCAHLVCSNSSTNRAGDGIVSISPVDKLIRVNGCQKLGE